MAQLEHAARTSLSSAAHNPVFVPPDAEHPMGRLFSTGGYHNAMAYPAFNSLNVAWADLALIAERHVTCLHTPAVSELPNLLALAGAPGSETNLFGWVATGYVEGARAAAAPTMLPACVNDARDDVSSPNFLAYAKERRAAECLDGVLAIVCSRREPGPVRRRPIAGAAASRIPGGRPHGLPTGRRATQGARSRGRTSRRGAVAGLALRRARLRRGVKPPPAGGS